MKTNPVIMLKDGFINIYQYKNIIHNLLNTIVITRF